MAETSGRDAEALERRERGPGLQCSAHPEDPAIEPGNRFCREKTRMVNQCGICLGGLLVALVAAVWFSASWEARGADPRPGDGSALLVSVALPKTVYKDLPAIAEVQVVNPRPRFAPPEGFDALNQERGNSAAETAEAAL